MNLIDVADDFQKMLLLIMGLFRTAVTGPDSAMLFGPARSLDPVPISWDWGLPRYFCANFKFKLIYI